MQYTPLYTLNLQVAHRNSEGVLATALLSPAPRVPRLHPTADQGQGQSLSHSVIQSRSHSVIQSLSHSFTQSLSHWQSLSPGQGLAQEEVTKCTQVSRELGIFTERQFCDWQEIVIFCLEKWRICPCDNSCYFCCVNCVISTALTCDFHRWNCLIFYFYAFYLLLWT